MRSDALEPTVGLYARTHAAAKAQSQNAKSDGELGSCRRKIRGGRVIAQVDRSRQGGLRLRQAFAAAGSNPEFAGEIAQAARPAVYGGADVSVGDGFAHTNYHGAIVNANANDCQYR